MSKEKFMRQNAHYRDQLKNPALGERDAWTGLGHDQKGADELARTEKEDNQQWRGENEGKQKNASQGFLGRLKECGRV